MSVLAGCFSAPDVTRLVCDDNQQCPSGYVCRVPGVVGGCCAKDDPSCGAGDGAAPAGLDTRPGADATGFDVSTGDSSMDQGSTLDVAGPIDRSLPDAPQTGIDVSVPDLPLGDRAVASDDTSDVAGPDSPADVVPLADVPVGSGDTAKPADTAKPVDVPVGGTNDCGALTNPANGSVTVTTTTVGSTASYACSVGYHLSQSTARTCQTDGTWSGVEPTCVLVDCGALSAPADGTIDAPSTTYGSIASYGCKPGFGPSGSSTRVCQADGTWSGSAPACVVSDCASLPGPAGGSVSAPTLTVGSTATYQCLTGYEMQGSPTRTCQAGGTWSGTAPTCAAVDCGVLPSLANGTVTATTTVYGSTATYACTTAGYQLSGSGTRTCQANKSWSGTAPTCVLVDCGAPPATSNGSVTATTTTFGSTATYNCTTAGYALSGPATRTCQADKTWSGTTPGCVLADCGAPDPLSNGSVNAPVTTYGSTATYACTTAGYVLSGGATRTCQSSRAWSGTAPTCVLVSCPALSDPDNGSVSVTSTTYGSTASYSCRSGFVLSGSSSTACQADGTWSNPKPSCGCANGLSPCGTSCVDLQSSNSNCGACGTTCSTTSPSTAQCTLGRCLVTIAGNQSTPTGIAVDATTVYWNTFGGTTMKAPIGGGAATPISTGQTSPWGIAVDGSSIFWTDATYVKKAPIGGGSVTTFASGYNNAAWVFSNGTSVFWNNTGTSPSFSDSMLMKSPVGGGSATPLASGAVIGSFAVESSYVYYIQRTPGVAGSGKIMKVAVAGGTSTPLASSQPGPYAIATDGSSVYWTNAEDHTLAKTSTSGGAVTPLATSVLEWGVATDGSYVYYATSTSPNAMMKVPVNGGSSTLLASGQSSPVFIKVDSTSLYWTNEADPGQVMKVTPK
jgi:CUB/sushi domain-containing protein